MALKKHKVKIRFDFSSPESTEYTKHTFQAQLKDTIGEKSIIKNDKVSESEGPGFYGYIILITTRTKKKILSELKNDDYLSEWEFK